MKNKITELNNLYNPLLEEIEKVRRCLGSHRIDHALGFFNNHHITIDNKIECIQYPIPTILCKLDGIKTKIGLDLATDEHYIGFIKFTLTREKVSSFNFNALKTFRIGIYGFYYYEEIVNFEDLEQIKLNAINSKEPVLYIKIRISSITQIMDIIDKMAVRPQTLSPQKRFSMTSYTCDCGYQITVETYQGQCPICGKDSPNRRKFETKCPVCNHPSLVDQYGNGECENCGWIIESESTTISTKCCGNYIWCSANKDKLYENKPAKYAYDFECGQEAEQ